VVFVFVIIRIMDIFPMVIIRLLKLNYFLGKSLRLTNEQRLGIAAREVERIEKDFQVV